METANKILEGTRDLVFRYGIRSITMDEIARHLGISKKTIYQSFEDKPQLVSRLMEYILSTHSSALEEIRTSAQNPIEEIILSMRYMGVQFSKMNPVLIHDLMRYFPEAWKSFRKFKEDFILRMIESNLQRGVESGMYRLGMNLSVVARLRVEESEMAMNPDIFPPDRFSILEVQQELLLHFLYGVCTLKGHKLINKYQQLHEED